ncbi:uncharacterized protein LOC135141956 [Zophobas morio]|uniref:uncharacterized protein LOC135141956 n=1 Tax=Zophobas morio TaxID=2755281 RepID=UPI0030827E49
MQVYWTEIQNTVGLQYSLDYIQKRWKQLRDEYVRARKKVMAYKPSGTEGEESVRPSFKHYTSMTFLNDVLDRAPTISNIVQPGGSREPTPRGSREPTPGGSREPTPGRSSEHTKRSASEQHTPTSKRKKTEDDIQQALLKVLQSEDKLDPVDGFLLRLGEGLRQLPYRNRARLEIQFLTLVQDELESLP